MPAALVLRRHQWSSTGARLHAHVGVVLQHDVVARVEVEERDGREGVGHAARRRHARVEADRLHEALDRRVVRRPQLLQQNGNGNENGDGDGDEDGDGDRDGG